jgi:hypothetical protein
VFVLARRARRVPEKEGSALRSLRSTGLVGFGCGW